jgi:hypothetical protein
MKATSWLVFALLSAPLVAQDAKRETMRGVNRGQPQPAAATLVLGVNAVIGSVSEPGWPLIVSAAWIPDKQSTSPTFPSNLQVKMTNEAGTVIPIPFEPVALPAAAASGEPHRYWLAPETATVHLAPGRYRVTAVSPSGASPGWKIDAVDFPVLAPNPERKGALSLVKMHRAVLLGRPGEALAEAEQGLTANARDIQLWIAKGDLLMREDDTEGALDAYDRALSLQRKLGRESFPLQQRRKDANVRALEKRGVIPPRSASP